MLRACLGTLLVLGALFGVYYWWLAKQFDPPGVYIGAAVMALVAGCSLGAVINSGMSYREWSLLSAARHDLPWRDGKWTAAAGTIHPVSEPVVAPFSGEECILCEYDVGSQHRVVNRDSNGNPGSDFTGFLMNPCVVRTNQGDVRLLGFPNLIDFGERTLTSMEAVRNARAFLLGNEIEDYSGLKMVSIMSVIMDAWNDDDGYVRKNVRLCKSPPEALFTPGIEAHLGTQATAEPVVPAEGASAVIGEATSEVAEEEDQFDDDELDDDDEDDEELNDDLDDDLADDLPPAIPLLKEKRVKVGDRVCAIGIYDERKRGLVPGGLGADRFVKLIRGDVGKAESEARTSTFGRLIGGFIGLVLVHVIAYGVVMANRHHPESVKHRQRDAWNAASKGDLPALEKLVARGLRVNDRNDREETLLSQARQPETVRWLIEHGADVNAKSSGKTPLIEAVLQGEPEIVKLLIDAKADLDARSDSTGQSAIDYARQRGRDDIVAILQAAGAKEGDVKVEGK